MKAFLPFLLVPALGLIGWTLAENSSPPPEVELPQLAALDAPPALGVVIPAPNAGGPVKVKMDALLPSEGRKKASEGGPAYSPSLPKVTAILVDGGRRVAQVEGMALTPGDRHGYYRVSAIEADRVLFEHPALRAKHWVPVTDR